MSDNAGAACPSRGADDSNLRRAGQQVGHGVSATKGNGTNANGERIVDTFAACITKRPQALRLRLDAWD
jgi:hypothetical protein